MTVAGKPPLGDIVSFKSGDLICHVPVHAITMVYQTPDLAWFIEVSGQESRKISEATAVFLLGEGTIYNGPRHHG